MVVAQMPGGRRIVKFVDIPNYHESKTGSVIIA